MFTFQETDLHKNNLRFVKDAVYYSELASDQYEIFWIQFQEKVFQWLDRLQEATKFKDQAKRRLHWNAT
jgi:hypothetical protein